MKFNCMILLMPILSCVTHLDKRVSKGSITTECGKFKFNYIHVSQESRKVSVCVKQRSISSFDASFGSRGFEKKRKGDRKTPIGLYPIAKPRPSVSKWRTFMHIGYPTREQVSKGYTGGDVGLHGPNQLFPYKNDLVDYGAGCVIMGTNESIDSIAEDAVKYSIRKIYIE